MLFIVGNARMNKMDSPYSQEADSITERFTSVHAHIYREAQDTVKNAVKKSITGI